MMASEYKSLEIAKYLIKKGLILIYKTIAATLLSIGLLIMKNVPFTKLMLENGAITNLRSIRQMALCKLP